MRLSLERIVAMLRSPHVPDYVGPKAMSKRGIFGKSPGFETNEVQTLGIS